MPRKPMTVTQGSALMQHLSLSSLMAVFPKRQIDKALSETKTASRRLRLLPAPAVVYLVMLMALWAEASIRENLRMLLEPLRRRFGLGNTRVPGGTAITKARTRLGAAPLRWLFEKLVNPVATPALGGCFWKGFRLVAADATTVDIQNTPANRGRFGIHTNQHGEVGYPQVKLVALMECGTRVPFVCRYGRGDDAEGPLFDGMRDALTKEMLLLADRAYYSFARWRACAERAGALVWRVTNNLNLKPLRVFEDGSYLAQIRPSSKLTRRGLCKASDRMIVRVVAYVPCHDDATEGERVRLITTLLDPEEASAEELAAMYPERWEIETGFDELKTHLRGKDRVLRSQRPDLVEQEIYGFLLAYYVVRKVIADAARKNREPPGTFSFTHAVRVIRRKLALFPPADTGPGLVRGPAR